MLILIKDLLNIGLFFVNLVLIFNWIFSGDLLKFLLINYKFLEVFFQLIIFEYLCILLFHSFLFINVKFWWLGQSVGLLKIHSVNVKWIHKLKSLSKLSLFFSIRFGLFISRVCLYVSLDAVPQCLFTMFSPKSSFMS